MGAAANTYSTAAFSLTSAHDVVLQGNNVTQSLSSRNPLPSGQPRYRAQLQRHNQSDLVTRNARTIGDEATYDVIKSAVQGLNDQEVTLEENDGAGVLFEGRPAATVLRQPALMLP